MPVSAQTPEPGIYLQFESPPGVAMKLESLEDKRQGIELVAVQEREPVAGAEPVQFATVFVPEGAVKHFAKRFEQYASETTKSGKPKHKDMVDRIAGLRLATLEALWTDAQEVYPGESESIWWEVWLRRHDGGEVERLIEHGRTAGFAVGSRRLEFDERIVTLVKATPTQFSGSLDVLNDLAEVRKAKEGASFFVDSSPGEQAQWVEDLKRRTTPPGEDAPAICLLDTGVNRGHPLLEDALAAADTHAVDVTWGVNDDGGGPTMMGHGTAMAGLALYGDLVAALASGSPIVLGHRLESVKILPPSGANPPELYGAITAEATSRVEAQAPGRRRSFSMAVTAIDGRDRGQPTSWSAAIDALAAGRAFDPVTQGLIYLDTATEPSQRLFVLSAGNVSLLEAAHLDRSDLEAAHDPAQAWNALTVGAFTEKAAIGDAAWQGWSPVAGPGDLSPWSTTSVTFAESWPIKPEVVFEGGNTASNANGEVEDAVPDLCLLSTYYKPAEKAFVLTNATSAASAQGARMAAVVSAEYPELWPETIRALIVHSARWTRAMQARLQGAGRKQARARLVRRYGFGVPDRGRALRSADDALTLLVQATMHPFDDGKMREMHVHELPWPKPVLEGLGQTPVTLRVTLSYFVEPNPARRGWKKRHRYASHGLRFEVKSPTETVVEFRKRLNQKALDEDEERPSTGGGSSAWYLGEQARNKGSLHSDIWVGTAADLAERGVIGVYPVSGWWKEQPKRDRSSYGARYTLVVSIETDATGIDIWTPVALEVGIPVESVVET